MTAEATAAVVTARGESPVPASVTLDALRDDEVLIALGASGICHTDLTAIDSGTPFGFPAVLGHEGAGTVLTTGAAVTHVRTGDRVVMTFDACGACRRCAAGHPAYCDEFAARNYRGARLDGTSVLLDALGAPVGAAWMAQSSWSTRAIARASNVVPIGDEIPFPLAAPLGCGVLTGAGTVLHVLRPDHHDRVLIMGAGAVGLAALMTARAVGCREITVVEPDAERARLARELGADRVLDPDRFDPRAVRHDLALDTVGTQGALESALASLTSPGTCATVALRDGANPVTVSQTALLWGRALVGVIEGDAVPARTIPLLVEMWRGGLLPLERIVTTFPFARMDDALAAARTGAAVKPVLVMQEPGDAPASVTPRAATGCSAAERVREIAERGEGDADELAMLWDLLPPAQAETLTGLWRGTGIDTGHRMHRTLARARWCGKNFVDRDDVQPLVCRDEHGDLFADAALGGGGAWLGEAVHRGKVVATMTYDARPVHDHFVRIDADAVLGVMAGRGTLDGGLPYFFVLRRDAGTAVGRIRERT